MEALLNIVTLLSAALLVLVLVSVRRAHIRVEYSVSWLAASALLLILSRCRGLLDWMAARLGLDYAPLVLILLGSCIFLGVFYRFSVILSELKDANIKMAQRVAILEYHLKSFRDHEKQEA